ncbi:helix-turn-helix domain containing protein [Lactiplantibacillus paraplantarum]|uniref:helix-turn-helix domain containing protein n=1 Tax=Lactiplantibacillus paraplantarum TaxID=60520 RepID=UPI002072ECDF|nr:helix-turn-helix domain containing protein [Lactiplantibacillus paraplantarum]
MAKKWLSVPEIAEELGINRQRVYRYISKYHIGYDKKLKHVNYYGEPVIKQVKEHFIVVDRISNIRTKITSDTGNKAKSVLKPDIEPQISDTKKRVLVQENDTAIQDSEIEEITKTLDYKGVKGDSIAVQSVLKDYRKQFEVLRQQLAQKDKQLGEKDEQLNKVYRLLDQQQQLELGAQKQLKLLGNKADLSTDNVGEVERTRKEPKTAEKLKKRHWWQRR